MNWMNSMTENTDWGGVAASAGTPPGPPPPGMPWTRHSSRAGRGGPPSTSTRMPRTSGAILFS